ncbi:MAG TPA: formylglycine-generating enzyme family protein [Labilithrix sp.]|nr:formylglycine-generating enzyme family protein [Labilithrix sp.]
MNSSRLSPTLVLSATLTVACQSSAVPPPPLPPNTNMPEQGHEHGLDASVSPDAGRPDVVASAVVDGDIGEKAVATATEEAPEVRAPEGMLLVKGGTFRMGADAGGEGDERPAHDVTVASFWLDQTEVTQSAYEECVAAKTCAPADPAILASYGGLFRGPQKPVVGISWHSARDYCLWRGKRLPREAEFERAVRGDDGRKFPWGNDPPTKERTVFSASAPEDVGTHPAGRGPYGHDDLAGNVWEWIDDDYDPFAYTRPTASLGKPGSCDEIIAAQNKLRAEGKQGFTGTNPIPTECEKSIRGGAYNYPAHGLRSTNRIHHPARFKLRMTGVRCAKDA